MKEHQTGFNAVMKVAIELHECKAFLGSPEVFERGVAFKFIVMEWHFKDNIEKEAGPCSKAELQQMTEMFVNAGYVPYGARKKKELDPSVSHLWDKDNVAWVHNSVIKMPWT